MQERLENLRKPHKQWNYPSNCAILKLYFRLAIHFPQGKKKKGFFSMRIILVGGGKVGTALARQLSEEDHSVTVIDTNKARVEHLSE